MITDSAFGIDAFRLSHSRPAALRQFVCADRGIFWSRRGHWCSSSDRFRV